MHSLFYDVIFSAKLLTLKYQVTLGLLAVLLALALRKYWAFTKKYAEFPTYSFLPFIAYYAVFRTWPRNIPITSFCFQQLITALKQFRNEGICLIWIDQPFLFIFGEEPVKIFSNEEAAVEKSYKYEILADAFGTGVLTSNGEIWRKHRKMFIPVFHVGVLKHKISILNQHAEILVKKLSEIADKRSVDAHQYIPPCSFGILCESIIGLKVDNGENEKIIKRYSEIIENLFALTVIRFCAPWLHKKFMLHFIPSGREYLKMYEEIHRLTEKMVLDMKESVVSAKSIDAPADDSSSLHRKSFAHILIEHHLENPSFTMEDVRSEVTTFITAGYDTVSYALLYCLFLLGHHPDIQEQVHNEMESIEDGHITYEDLHKLKYLECVIKETLRLYPPVPVYARRINKDIQCGKYLVPKGTNIAFCPYMLHRDPEIYPDPEKFDPERFLEGNLEKRHWIYTPFSEGIRSCIGKKFAMMEMMVVLTHVLRNFRVTSLDKREDIDLCWDVTLIPAKHLHFQLTSRK